MATLLETPAVARPRPAHLLDLDPPTFGHCFNRTPFLIGHHLAGHPLFQIERLLELVQRLPATNVEYNAGHIPKSIAHDQTPMNGLSPEETVRRIAECKSWLVMKYVEQDPAYRQLLDECLAEVAVHSEAIAPGMMKGQAFIFITSPQSVTPFHIDPEHNFLLQIRGGKTVHLYDGRDRSLLSEQDLENFYTDRGRNLQHRPEFDQNALTFSLQPGMGLHFPVTYPHWVQNQDEVSISFSITFRTPDLDRRQAVYRANARLRERGWAPPAVGQQPWRDELVYQSARVSRKLGALFGKK